MPETSDELITNALGLRESLVRKWGSVWAQLTAIQSDIDSVTALLARYGHVDQPQPTTASSPPMPEEQSASIDDGGQPVTLDDAVAKYITDFGSAAAAKQFCEWALKYDQVARPTTVRALLESFTPSLRRQYNPDRTSAVETLRSQIKTWVTRGETDLSYDGGYVDLRPGSDVLAGPVMEEGTA